MSFVHLHNHTDHSFLDGACKVSDLCAETARLGMPAIAITDHGNLCGAPEFYKASIKNDIKPIIGCELYLTDGKIAEKSKDIYGKKKPIFHQLLIAKNEIGWKNLVKLSSIGYIDGFYHKPRIDYELLEKHHEGLICLSSCMQSHLHQTLLRKGEAEADKVAYYLKDMFGDDLYLEIQNHDIPEEAEIVKYLRRLSKKIGSKIVATNDTHYLKREHAASHDILLCVNTKSNKNDQNRFRFPGEHFYLKTEEEMLELFNEVPEALTNTLEVAEKVEFEMKFGEKHFPEFQIPDHVEVKDDYFYLRQLCQEGLPQRYDEVTDEIRERMEFELNIIKMKHLASYFLIVRDFIKFAHAQKIPVGPGRGSAAGSLVSYLVEITNIDPMKYNLLFERFINPERESYPDIDVDFADDRRAEVIEYVRQKYGKDCVSQIITYGRMLSKAVIKDVGRVLEIPLQEVEAITKLIPDAIGGKAPKLKNALEEVKELKDLVNSRGDYQEMMDLALVLEGTIRNSGVHAAGVVITPEPVSNFVPLMCAADGNAVTQFDMSNAESLGLLKVDFLGLKTLSILENTLKLINQYGHTITLETIPIDDKEAYELFARGDTIGIFQFESSGMRENLRKLIPERLEDLIAMNALYRPGPMGFIDNFVDRKHGKEEITYLHDMLADILDETYGIIVYQEQVMQIANKLAGMSLGRADLLRRAMGKKKQSLMDEMMPEFVEGCGNNGIDKKTAKDIWQLIDKFAAYGFNKSHSAGYALVAYQTGYLKAHHPAEFMAASMTTRKDKTEELVLFLEECRRMNVDVLPPDVNSSDIDFAVNRKNQVLFGLTAIKGVGSGAIQNLIGERETKGDYTGLFELTSRIDSRLVNKKVLENLIYAGATDALEGNRRQHLESVESAIAYGQQAQKERMNGQGNIFGEVDDSEGIMTPDLPKVEEWKSREKLAYERERLGFYFSGHPLEKYRIEAESLSSFKTCELSNGSDGQPVRVAGLFNGINRMQTKKGDFMAKAKLEDLSGVVDVIMFPKTYEKIREKLVEDEPILLSGRLKCMDDQAEIIVDDFEPLESAANRLIRGMRVLITEGIDANVVIELEEVFRKNPGRSGVRVVFKSDNGEMFHLSSKKYKVAANRELLSKAQELVGTECVRLETVS
jgi:DNA polymerase III subunit alpha